MSAAPEPRTHDDTPEAAQQTAPSEPTETAAASTAAAPGTNTQAPIEVDSRSLTSSDADSSYGDDESLASFTASLTSSIMNYQVENGRRYHAYREGSQAENDRLDLQHQMLKIAMDDKLYYAPIGKKPERILDIGTGTGLWALEMADEFTDTEIIGTDLSPIQPNWVPPNVQFQIDDVEAEWTFPHQFDMIHSRYMIGSIMDWPALIKRVFKATKPGGWAEFQDYDVRFYSEDNTVEGTDLHTWVTQAYEAGEKLGRTVSPAIGLVERVRAAGFTDIHHSIIKIPLGQWPKDPKLKQIGTWNVLNILEGLEGWSLKLYTHGLGWSVPEIEVLLAKCRKDIRNPRIHAQQDFHIVYGRKPVDSTED